MAGNISKRNLKSFPLFDLVDFIGQCSSKIELRWSQGQRPRKFGLNFDFASDNFIVSEINDRLSGSHGNNWFDDGFQKETELTPSRVIGVNIRSPGLVSPISTGSNSECDFALASRRDGRIIAGRRTPSPRLHLQDLERFVAFVLYGECMGDDFPFKNLFEIEHVFDQAHLWSADLLCPKHTEREQEKKPDQESNR